MFKNEGNILILISSAKKIMTIFLGPFLTAYFIKTSQDSLVDLSFYYILCYFLLGTMSFIIAKIIENKFRIGMFRLGVTLNFMYIMMIILLKEDLVNHLPSIAILYGISAAIYWFPYNLFVVNKIDNSLR